MITKLSPGRYYLDCGPVQMNISAVREPGLKYPSAGDQSAEESILDPDLLAEIEALVISLLTHLSSTLHLAKQPAVLLQKGQAEERDSLFRKCDSLFTNMHEAAIKANEKDLTPMAAVAGAFADRVGACLAEKGATRYTVNNGGDIALNPGIYRPLSVGLKADLSAGSPVYPVKVAHQHNIGGIATSGLGGRGFTRGIASAVTIFAADCAIADACATAVANRTFIEHPGILRAPADKFDPETDLKGQLITVCLSDLDQHDYRAALECGLNKAKELLLAETIKGAIIFCGPYVAAIPDSIEQLVKAGQENKVNSALNPASKEVTLCSNI